MKRSNIFLVYLPALMLASLLLPAMPRAARGQHPLGRVVEPPEAPCVYVIGDVVKQQALNFKAPFTVTQAIAMAGGLRRDAKKDRVRIIRTNPGGIIEPTIIAVDLKAIKKRRAPDVLLQPYDIVDVGRRHGLPGHPMVLMPTPMCVIH